MAFTPAIIQYLDIKKAYTDCILFFRMWDFYETFFEDAKTCSKVLDIVLTSKNKNSENSVPMAGIPYHSADKYITKLIANGYKVAIAEQTSDPVPGKIVERAVVNVITPGTYIQETKKEFIYTMAITFVPYIDRQNYHIARGDFSIGDYWTKSFTHVDEALKFILTIRPVELIFDVNFPEKETISVPLQHYMTCLISVRDLPPDLENFLANTTHVQKHTSYGKALEAGRLAVTCLLFYYLKHTQKHSLTNITKISFHSQDTFLILDEVTIKNLEILSSSYEHSEKYSLLHSIDNTQTAGGSRLLRYIITNPIKDQHQITRRLDNIEHYLNNGTMERWSPSPQQTNNGSIHNDWKSTRIHQLIHHVRDISKLVSTLLYKKLLPSTFIKLRSTLRIFLENKFLLDELCHLGLSETAQNYVQHLYNYLEQILKNDEEYKDDIDFIRDGYQNDIDELRKIAYHSDELLMQYQQELAQIWGIPNIKVKFILNQWYFLEVTNKDIQQFEKQVLSILWWVTDNEKDKYHVIRRNTLKGSQRYSSPYLEDLQINILKAKDTLRALEFSLLQQAQQKITEWIQELNEFAEKISRLDVFVSQALLAKEKKFIKPEFIWWDTLTIIEWRHPVIENHLPSWQQFIPNSLQLDETTDEWFLHIITWPNMWGKSTYLRQNALIVLMAHCGLFVPAKECKLSIMDAIFARIGSGDIIAKNQSTFMTEMIEVANILNNASKKSFIIFDELGRWTATYDGLALTKAILEYLVTHVGSKTLIATHYHELIQLEETLPGVKNFSVSVYETEKEVVFMKKIVSGWASKSYGLDVAKIAGIPKTILEQARIYLDTLEQKQRNSYEEQEKMGKDVLPFTFPLEQHSEISLAYEKIKSLLKSYDLNDITPLQALQLLSKIKDDLE